MYPNQPVQPTQQPAAPQPTQAKGGKGKKITLIAVLVLAVAAVAGGIIWWLNQNQSDASLQQDAPSVSITADGYSPSTIKVKVGEEVTWTNTDSTQHEITADAEAVPGFGSTEALNTGDTYSYTFEDAGTYNYYDPAAPAKLNGTVIVE